MFYVKVNNTGVRRRDYYTELPTAEAPNSWRNG